MIISYEVYVRHEVYQILRDARRFDRQRILNFIESLADNPFDAGDYVERDSTGRECQVKILGPLAVFYWSDHAEREVRVVDLIEADLT